MTFLLAFVNEQFADMGITRQIGRVFLRSLLSELKLTSIARPWFGAHRRYYTGASPQYNSIPNDNCLHIKRRMLHLVRTDHSSSNSVRLKLSLLQRSRDQFHRDSFVKQFQSDRAEFVVSITNSRWIFDSQSKLARLNKYSDHFEDYDGFMTIYWDAVVKHCDVPYRAMPCEIAISRFLAVLYKLLQELVNVSRYTARGQNLLAIVCSVFLLRRLGIDFFL